MTYSSSKASVVAAAAEAGVTADHMVSTPLGGIADTVGDTGHMPCRYMVLLGRRHSK